MGDEGLYKELFRKVAAGLKAESVAKEEEIETPEFMAQNLRSILESRPRDKKQWRTTFDKDVIHESKIPKTRYSFNTFATIDGNVQLVLKYFKDHNIKIDTIEIEKTRYNMLNGFDIDQNEHINGINELRDKTREIAQRIIKTIPQDLKNKYGDNIIWSTVQKGTFLMAAEKLVENSGENMDMNTDPRDGMTSMQIINLEKTRINDIKRPYQSEVIHDLGEYHQRYVDQVINPIEGAPVSDELVDELERLVDITIEALSRVRETVEYQDAA
jgi:hypothetical protein